MEGGRRHSAPLITSLGLDASPHVLGRLGREGQGEDTVALAARLIKEAHDSLRQDLGLAGTGRGSYKVSAFGQCDDGSLLWSGGEAGHRASPERILSTLWKSSKIFEGIWVPCGPTS